MLSLIATVLVLAFLVYIVWPWFWHIVTALVLILFVYIAWPWLKQPWEDLMSSWLQQIHLPQASAANTPSGRLHVYRQRTDESRIHFEEAGQEEYPRPYPRPFLCAKDWAGKDVFLWEGRRWYLPHNEEPYRYLCVPEKRLEWCWRIPPNASAVPCKSPDTGKDGWCWGNEVSYRRCISCGSLMPTAAAQTMTGHTPLALNDPKSAESISPGQLVFSRKLLGFSSLSG
jgi:hypothetical protein